MPGDNHDLKHIYPERVKASERAIVSCVLAYPGVYESTGLRGAHFFDPVYRAIWEAVGSLRASKHAVDPITVGNQLNGKLEAVGGLGVIAQLMCEASVSETADLYSTVVRDAWVAREVYKAGRQFQQVPHDGIQALSDIRSSLDLIETEMGGDAHTLSDTVDSIIADNLSGKAPEGLPTGTGLERIVPGGIPRGVITTIFSDTGSLKSTLKHHLVCTFAEAGHRVLDACFEDGERTSGSRFLAKRTGIPYNMLHGNRTTPEQKLILSSMRGTYKSVTDNIIADDNLTPDIDNIIFMARRYKVSAVFIDYIQLLTSKRSEDGTKETMDNALRKAQQAARRDNVAYIFVSQRKQGVDPANPRPSINEHLLGSAFIKQASKLVLGVFRPWLYQKVPPPEGIYLPYNRMYSQHPEGARAYEELIEMWVLKNVLGETQRYTILRCDLPTSKISEFRMESYVG